MIRSLWAAVLDTLFPPLCHACKSFIPDAGTVHLCASCQSALKPLPHPHCTVCGEPFAGICADHPCGKCCSTVRPYAAARAAFVHIGPIQGMIHDFKYRHKTLLRRPLGLLTAEALAPFAASCSPDMIVPVPLHRKRLRSRGFNQTVLLGDILARSWKLPLERSLLKRTRWTEPQINLPATERRTNVKGAFTVTAPDRVTGKRIILLDDVMTTGSTVEECSNMLVLSGAALVAVVTVSRAVEC